MRNFKKKFIMVLALGGCFALLNNCGASKDSAIDTSTTSVSSGGLEVDNALAEAFPGTLALSAFPQSISSSSLALEETSSTDEMKKTVKEKIDDRKKILEGTADSCLDLNLFKPAPKSDEITCYEFDSDMNPSKFADSSIEYGTVDGKDSKGEACMVAFTRSQIKETVNMVDKTLALISGMMCQSKKDGDTEKPTVGTEKDLTAALKKAAGSNMTVSEAKIKRLDDIDGNPVYKSIVKIKDPEGKDFEVNLVHSPGDNETNKGTLWVKTEGETNSSMENDPNNTANKNFVMSINYSRVLDSSTNKYRVRFEVRRAAIINTVEPFDDNGFVNYNAVSKEASNSEIHAIQYIAFDVDPDTNEGDLSYFMNPGGSYDESARGFLFNIEKDASSGVLKGCGVSGSTQNVSIRKAIAEPSDTNILKPVKYWHPREDQNISSDKDSRYDANEGNYITKQCFAQNATTGAYDIDTSVTTSSRGYDVIENSSSTIHIPEVPKDKIDGEKVKIKE